MKWRRPRKDIRTWRSRKHTEFRAWDSLIEPLTDAYARWKYGTSPGAPQPNVDSPPSTARAENPSGDPTPSNATPGNPNSDNTVVEDTMPAGTVEYSVHVFEIFTLQDMLTIERPQSSSSVAVDLAENGFLPKTPTLPSFAVGFRTLELFHRLRLRKPSLSVEAFTHVICDYYMV